MKITISIELKRTGLSVEMRTDAQPKTQAKSRPIGFQGSKR